MSSHSPWFVFVISLAILVGVLLQPAVNWICDAIDRRLAKRRPMATRIDHEVLRKWQK